MSEKLVYKQESKSFTTRQEWFDYYLKDAVKRLKIVYGIEQLKNNEYLRLRQIVAEVMERKEKTDATRIEERSGDTFYVEMDVPILFIQREYGILEADIPKPEYTVMDFSTSQTYNFNYLPEAKQKARELGERARIYSDMRPTEDFIKYLSKIRENPERHEPKD